ncbi:MAG: 6-phosphofructokinase, partial [Poseidonibacter sp.]
VSLGHIQRGGNPSVFDRLMANEFITLSIDKLLTENTKSVIIYKNSSFQFKQIEDLSDKTPTINPFLLKQLEKMIK